MAIQDNSIKTKDGIEVYKSMILSLVDDYMQDIPDTDIYDNFTFSSLLLYISNNIPKIPYEDIQLLDNVFNIYISLCSKYKKLPSLEMFSVMVDVSGTTFNNWINGTYRAQLGSLHLEAVKKWKNICKNFLINDLQNSNGSNINKIFIAKAAYGMAETAPVQAQATQQAAAIEDIQARYKEISVVNDDSFYSADSTKETFTDDTKST